ncbi:MAG: site-specific integrase [Dehalococcoidia bacterium]|nr:site-specific integrase [Dehalococcoidia bacterium]
MEERTPGHWLITIELSRDPATGRRRRQRCTVIGKKRDAQKALREALNKRDMGLTVATTKITVAEWLSGWLERHEAEGHIGATAHERYEGIIRVHLTPMLGALRLQQLRPDQIAEAKARWLSGKESTAKGPLAGSTVHKHMVVLREALDDALRAGLIPVNPIQAVRAPSVRAAAEQRALSEAEITTLLAEAKGTRYDVPIRTALASGMREGELLGARWEDFDPDAAILCVRQTLVYVRGKVSFKEPKSENSRRTLELSAGTVRLLRAHRAAQKECRLALGAAWQDHGLIFPSTIGTPWLPRAFFRGYRAIVAAAASPRETDEAEGRTPLADPKSVDFHCLRHTAGSQWILHGVDIFTVSRRLGHASAAFTMNVYGHLLKGQQKTAAEALDHLLAADG